MSDNHVNASIAVLLAAGGLMGARKGSMKSLYTSLGFSAMFGVSSYLIMSGNRVRGFQVGAGASAPLAAIMAYRALNAGKFMPAGMVAVIGAIGLAFNLLRYFAAVQSKASVV